MPDSSVFSLTDLPNKLIAVVEELADEARMVTRKLIVQERFLLDGFFVFKQVAEAIIVWSVS